MDKKKNLILIGMPACGKSTVGVVLAKSLGMHFLDTDILIQDTYDMLLQDLVDQKGIDAFIETEADILSSLKAEHSVISTGGSAVYRDRAMDNLRENGISVYISLSLPTIKERLNNIKTRGIAMKPGETLDSLYEARLPLYEKHADLTINGENNTVEEVVSAICSAVKNLR